MARRGLAVALVWLSAALLQPGSALATHEASEPSDGTVASFRMFDPPRQPPPFQVFDSDGQAVTPANFDGKVVLLNLWATWCAPCIREMPALDRLQGKIGKDDFLVVPVSLDREGLPVVEAFYKRLGLQHLGIWLDPDVGIKETFPVDVLPANFLIDRKGRVTGFLRSYVDWDAPEAEAFIRKLMAAPIIAR